MTVRVPSLELLWWAGCPSTDRARAELQGALIRLGLDGVEIAMREIQTVEDAVQTRFVGSPTILIDGVDLIAALGAGDATEPTGLNCRVYRRRDGRVAPTPDPDDLREALIAASEREEVKR